LILEREIALAVKLLDDGDCQYSKALWTEMRSTIRRLRLRSLLFPPGMNSNIQFIFWGIATYASIVSIFGACAVIVHMYRTDPESWPIRFVSRVGLLPLFQTVSALGIKPSAYLWGLFGGAGAVVSIVKRFDELAQRTGSPWLFFLQGLFNPIVGSLSAVVACKFASASLVDAYKGVPLLAIAFFAGFSERLLERVQSQTSNRSVEKNQ
jgi:hypothetical protein